MIKSLFIEKKKEAEKIMKQKKHKCKKCLCRERAKKVGSIPQAKHSKICGC